MFRQLRCPVGPALRLKTWTSVPVGRGAAALRAETAGLRDRAPPSPSFPGASSAWLVSSNRLQRPSPWAAGVKSQPWAQVCGQMCRCPRPRRNGRGTWGHPASLALCPEQQLLSPTGLSGREPSRGQSGGGGVCAHMHQGRCVTWERPAPAVQALDGIREIALSSSWGHGPSGLSRGGDGPRL